MIAAIKPDLKADLGDIKRDTAAIRTAIEKQPMGTHYNDTLSREEQKEPAGDDTGEKLWFKEVEAIYKGNATGKEYTRYNLKFISWFSTKYGKKNVTEQAVREHIQEVST